MSITTELAPSIEARLRNKAKGRGVSFPEYLIEVAEQNALAYPLEGWDMDWLMSLPDEEQNRIMTEAASHAASLYEADMALPAAERELTAFMVLDDMDPVLETYILADTDD